MQWQTTPNQRSLRELGCCGFWCDYFDRQHIKDSITVLTKPRRGHRRIFLYILLISMALYTFQRDEGNYFYMYTFGKFNWQVSSYSTFKTFKSAAFVIAMLLGVPLMNKFLGWRDTVSAARLLLPTASSIESPFRPSSSLAPGRMPLPVCSTTLRLVRRCCMSAPLSAVWAL